MTTRHYFSEHQDITEPVACGGRGYNFGGVTDRARVTCKRCLASLAKRDREFQEKARKGIRRTLHAFALRGEAYLVSGYYERDRAAEAARAIAREEGRVL